jgi:hypothetical protein
MPIEQRPLPWERITQGPFFHFFGYYDKTPWDSSGRYLLGLRTAFMDRPPTPDDIAVIGMIDLDSDRLWHTLSETVAWCWQQGTMLQWLPTSAGQKIIFNSRADERYRATILDATTGERRLLAYPIYALSPTGHEAVTLNFSRVHRTRPGYGYRGVSDPWQDQAAPNEDGLYHVDLQTGDCRLTISLAQMAGFEPTRDMQGAVHWFNHLQFDPTGSRFIFLHRWSQDEELWRTRLFTANPDGSEITLLSREGMVSHFDWRDENHILAWSRHEGEDHYHLYQDRSDHVEVVGPDVLLKDGHCSYSPDRRWILTDEYPDRIHSERTLILYHPQTDRRIDIGRFYSAPQITGEIRCDLHPRWNRTGTHVCLDSIHEGERQMYVINVSSIVNQG